MDATEFVKKVRRTNLLLQGVTIRFAANGFAGLARLKSLLRHNGNVRLAHSGDGLVIEAVLLSGTWDNDRNRSYTLYGLPAAEDGWLTEIAKDVENIAVTDHGAMTLGSSRQKMRDAAAGRIVDAVLTSRFVNELWGWKIDVSGSLEDLEGLPILIFRMTFNHAEVASVAVDGWSGGIMVDGKFISELYAQPSQIQRILHNRLEVALEDLTSPAAA